MINKYLIDKVFFLSSLVLIFLSTFTITLILFNTFLTKITLNLSTIISLISAFTIFAIIGAIVISSTIPVDSEIHNIIKKKYRLHKIATICFICICILGIPLFSNTNIKQSLGALAFLSIVFIFFFPKALMISMQNYKDNLYKLDNLPSSNYKCNLLWRYKIWTTPKVKTDLTLSNLSLTNTVLLLFFFIMFIFSKNISFKVIFFLLLLIEIFCIMEIILGFHTSLIGVCTENYIIRIRHKKYIQNRKPSYQYAYIITDFNTKHEISFSYRNKLDLKPGDTVTIIHSVFSKKIYMVNGLILKSKFELN